MTSDPLRAILLIAIIAVFTSQTRAASFTSESATELSATLDTAGSGSQDLLLIDKATGVRQLALQQTDGSFVWSDPASTGLDNVTALSVGRFSSSGPGEGFALAAPTWNRVELFPNVNGDGLDAPTTGIGPNLVVAFDFAGDALDDLAIATQWDSPPNATHLAGIASGAAGLSVVAAPAAEAGPLSQGNPARFKSDRTWILGAMRPAIDSLEFITRSFTLPGNYISGPTLSGLSTNTSWAWGEFGTNAAAQFLFYAPGATTLQVPGLTEPTPQVFAWTPGQTFDLGQPIAQVFVLSQTNGALLLVTFSDGSTAATYDFDGSNPPALRQTLSAPAGMKFSLAGALGRGNFLLLHGPNGGQGNSTGWQRWNWNGSTHTLKASGAIPPLSPARVRANVLLYGANPDLTADPPLLQILRAGEWSVSASLTGAALQVAQERLSGATTGLGPPTTVTIQTKATSPIGLFPVVNQRSGLETVVLLSPSAIQPFGDLTFSPPPGTYHLATNALLAVRITPTPTAPVFYRANPSEPWHAYDAASPPQISVTTTLMAYVDGAPPSPIRTATYVIAAAPLVSVPPLVDANHNGLPDAWEQAFGLSDPNGDADGDGFTNLQEYLGGTDPLDPSSTPGASPNTFELAAVHPDSNAPPGTLCEIIWSSDLVGSVLETTTDLTGPAVWTTVSAPIAAVGNLNVYYQPVQPDTSPRFFRLRMPR